MPPPPPRLFAAAAAALLLARPASASAATLREVASVATAGCAGFEAFLVGGALHLGAANFWDGSAPDMGADSVVYRVEAADSEEAAAAPLTLTELQRVRGQGAYGLDFFEGAGERWLALPSYYGCGSARGPADTAPGACASTLVLRFDAARGAFVEHQRLATAGPAQTDHLVTRNGAVLLVVGENFDDCVTLFELDAATLLFARRQSLRVPGAGSMAIAEVGDEIVLVAASYHDPGTGWSTRSLVFAADARGGGAGAGGLDFKERQRLDTHGAHDADVAVVGGEQLFLFLSEDRSDASSRIDSSLLTWDREARRFRPFQKIPTDGAHAAEIFQGPDNAAYVMVSVRATRMRKLPRARASARTHFSPQPARTLSRLRTLATAWASATLRNRRSGGSMCLAPRSSWSPRWTRRERPTRSTL